MSIFKDKDKIPAEEAPKPKPKPRKKRDGRGRPRFRTTLFDPATATSFFVTESEKAIITELQHALYIPGSGKYVSRSDVLRISLIECARGRGVDVERILRQFTADRTPEFVAELRRRQVQLMERLYLDRCIIRALGSDEPILQVEEEVRLAPLDRERRLSAQAPSLVIVPPVQPEQKMEEEDDPRQ